MNDFIEEHGPIEGWCQLPLGTLPPQKVCCHVVQTWKPLLEVQ
jgi:hypothetical protein